MLHRSLIKPAVAKPSIQFAAKPVYFLFFIFILACAPSVFAADGAVTPKQGKTMIEQNNELVILDVRNPDELAAACYPGAVNIPVKELEARIAEIPAGKPVLIHCARGVRAESAYTLIKEKRADIPEVFFIKGRPIFPKK